MTKLDARQDPPTEQGGTHSAGHGHGHWAMIACCIPMLVIAVVLVAAGVVGAGFIFAALMCTLMMALMMRGMAGSSGEGGRHH